MIREHITISRFKPHNTRDVMEEIRVTRIVESSGTTIRLARLRHPNIPNAIGDGRFDIALSEELADEIGRALLKSEATP